MIEFNHVLDHFFVLHVSMRNERRSRNQIEQDMIIIVSQTSPSTLGTSLSLLLHVSDYKVYHYILFMGGNLILDV